MDARPRVRARPGRSKDVHGVHPQVPPFPVGQDSRRGYGVCGVLTVAKVSGRGAVGYAEYLEGKATASELGDYYLKGGERVEAPGRWVSGAGAVGCDGSGPVSGEALRALVTVRRPDTGGPLRPVGAGGLAVAALDATFSAPKSVSAAWAVAGPVLRERIEQAHEVAIDRALRYAGQQVAMVRERLDRQTVVHTRAGDIVATSWRHTTARAVEGRPPDPQLHSHVLLHAAVRQDGKVVAIDSRAWLLHRREIGAAYRTELAGGLERLGFEIERGTGRGGRYFEIKGVPRQLIDRWSSRHHQVREAIEHRIRDKTTELTARIAHGGSDAEAAKSELAALRHSGQLAAGEDRYMSYATRSAKLQTTVELDRDWASVATEDGFDRGDLSRLLQIDGRRPHATVTDDAALVSALTEFDATFTEREARAVALERSTGVRIEEALGVLDRLRADGELLVLADGHLTTRRHRAAERATVNVAERLTHTAVNPVPDELVERGTLETDQQLLADGGVLSEEQRRAVAVACGDRQLVMIEGQAGTGKSTTLQAIARAHDADGRALVLTSTAALAAQRLAGDLADAGVIAPAYSTAALVHAIRSGQLVLSPATTVIHDEAALASTREQHMLLGAVEAAGARLIVVGDPRQSHPVGAGGLWSRLERTAREEHAHVQLTRNLRARHPDDRRDQKLFRDGEHEQALRGYADRHSIQIGPDRTAAEDRALEAAHHDRRDGKRTLVIAQTSNEQLDELNARAQAIRLQAGELDQDSVAVPGRPYELHVGDEIQLRRTISDPGLGQLRNGTTATLTAANGEEVALQLSNGRVVRLGREQLERAEPRLAYVQHPFPAQGVTTDTAHLIVAEHATREGTYVALTRARRDTMIHAGLDQLTDDPDQAPIVRLADRLGRTEPDLPSIATPLEHEQRTQRELANDASDATGAVGTSVLGPRPAGDRRAATWDAAAETIETYRERYGIDPNEPGPLGPEPPPGNFRQRLDRRQVMARLADALADLDHPNEGRELLALDRTDHERDIGWEP